jgi:hypothetical protein
MCVQETSYTNTPMMLSIAKMFRDGLCFPVPRSVIALNNFLRVIFLNRGALSYAWFKMHAITQLS